jgi:hypothetical protein
MGKSLSVLKSIRQNQRKKRKKYGVQRQCT